MFPIQTGFLSRRSPIYARHGIVASSQPLATQAGIEILMKGGNAADAAVATAAALNVTEPCSTGLGGDCFLLYFDAETKVVTALNGSGRAPASLSLDLLKERGITDMIPGDSPHAITVPGACAGWVDCVDRYGRLRMAEVLAPAIWLAEEGFPVAPLTSYFWEMGVRTQLQKAPNGHELMVDGRAPKPGEIMRNPTLARTLEAIAEGGKDAFYVGAIAEKIVAIIQSQGGVMSTDDLASHTSSWDTPISTVYRGTRVFECPPNGQGLAALIALNILTCLNISVAPLSGERLHAIAEALRLAFADAHRFVDDPAMVNIPIDELLSMDYAQERARLFDPDRASTSQQPGMSISGSDTVYLSVVDGEGNACSFINSNYRGFGTGIVPEGTGFTLQNRGCGFSLDPNHPNALAPLKRPYHTIIPAMATRESDGSLFACFGVMGAFMQPQGHVQVVMGLLDDGLDPQAVLDRPRICLSNGSPSGDILVEEGIPQLAVNHLAAKGHRVVTVSGIDRHVFGRGQVIVRDSSTGVLCGGSDPRADGCAIGL